MSDTDGRPGLPGLHLRRGDDLAPLIDALAGACGGRAGRRVLDDLDRQGRRSWAPGRAVDRSWTFDLADRRDLRWWPQGVDLGADPGADLVDDPVVAMTWYAKKLPGDPVAQGARVTFFDVGSCRYRHVLLVRPTLDDGVPGVAPLRVHAGGLLWAGGHLHVAATAKGFWTAHLDDVLQVPDGGLRGAGITGDTYGYRYVLPVRWAHRAGADEGVEPLRYSFFSRDGDDMLVGEYAAGERSRRLVRIGLDAETMLPADDATPELLGHGVGHMQGAVRVRDDGERWYVTTSHGRWKPGSVWTGTPGGLVRHRWATPMGPEDLTVHPGTGDLWSVTEHPWARWIYTMKRSSFD